MFGDDTVLRLAIFAGIFATMALLELWLPKRALSTARRGRWTTNLALIAIDTALLRVATPVVAILLADRLADGGFGLLALVSIPMWAEVVVAFVLLDLGIWAQHVAFHKSGWLWRFHKVHHADRDLDVTSAARFHPGETLISMVWKLALVALIGPPAVAVLLFEIALNGAAMFNHSNVALGERTDRWLRRAIVTPDMHRVHHSVERRETDSNYGFFLPVWDRLFGTYRAQPDAGHDAMQIGLPEHRGNEHANLWWSLSLPFKRDARAPTDQRRP